MTSFALINSFVSGVSDAIDPRTQERARRLCAGVLWPVIQPTKPAESRTLPLEFVDVGAGSGSLSACLCRQIGKLGASVGLSPKIRVWFVDLAPSDPTRFFRSAAARRFVDTLMFLGNDYRDWLSKPQPLPASNGLRIALISKLFNNLSHFSVQSVGPEDVSSLRNNKVLDSDISMYLPALCLAPGGRGADALQVSNSRVTLGDGRAFVQLSLSEFYRGFSLLALPQALVEEQDAGAFLPIRTFNPDCLITLDGRSVIACLAQNCNYVLIEDPDLTPNDLVAHMRRFSLSSITIQNLTKTLGLTGNFAYLLWSRTKEEQVPSLGEPLW